MHKTYRILAQFKQAFLLSDPITFTREEPFKKIRLEFEEGVSLSGRVLLPNGEPPPSFFLQIHHRFSNVLSTWVRVNEKGYFRIEHLNTAYDPSYWFELNIRNFRDWKVTLPRTELDLDSEMTIRLQSKHIKRN